MKRFYTRVAAEPTSLGWHVSLDGRPVRTQGGAPQVVPTEALARLLASEWEVQGETIDPAGFAARDMADYAIDTIASDREGVIDRLLRFAETDTLCYRADPDEPLFVRQQAEWEPLLTAFEAREGVALERTSGVLHRPQCAATLAALRQRLEALDPFTLAAVEQMASLAASLSVALSALEDGADGQGLWRAANLEEDWQIEQWGEDEEAAATRARREREFLAAIEFARAAQTETTERDTANEATTKEEK